jgi:WD40 repeat protein
MASRIVSSSDSILVHDLDAPNFQAATLVVKSPHLYGRVNSVTWSHNNSKSLTTDILASGGEDGRIVLLKSESGAEVNRLEITKGFSLNKVRFSSTSQFIAAASGDNTVRLYDLKSKRMCGTINDHSSEVLSVSFSPSDSLIASSSVAGQIFITERENTDNSSPFILNDFKCRSVEFSQMKENLFASGHDDGSLVLWDISGAMDFKYDTRHTDAVTGLCFSPLNHMLMGSCGLDRQVVFYDVHKAKKIVESRVMDEQCTSISFNADGFTVAIGTQEGNVLVLDLRNLDNPLRVLKGHSGPVTEVAFRKKSKTKKKADKPAPRVKESRPK